MAIFKLGAFATAIVGSIGGTNFRRGGNNAIVTNKSFGASKTKLLSNKQLNPIAQIFKKWSNLSPTLKDDWNSAALLFEFPDKFGVQRNITGRQLYTKLNIQLLPVGLYNEDTAGITSTIGTVNFSSGFVDVENKIASFNTFVPVGAVEFTVAAEVSQNILGAPIFNRREILYNDTASDSGSHDFGFQFFEKFPYFDANYTARFYFNTINNFGFKGVPVALTATTI